MVGVVGVALSVMPPAGASTSPPSGGSVTNACQAAVTAGPTPPDPPLNLPSAGPLPPSQPVSQTGPRGCRSVEALEWMAAAACRFPLRSFSPAAPRLCTPVDGRDISAAQIAAYQASWVHRALGLQRGLDNAAPLVEEQIPHTHNSYNSSAYQLPDNGRSPSYYPTLTNQDPNQVYSLAGQLDMDVRFLELDLHWVPSPYGTPATGGRWVTLCHGDSANPAQVHVGCTDDRPLQDGLAEIRAWMDRHPDQFVFIYFENQLNSDPQAHQIAGDLIDRAFDRPSTDRSGKVVPAPGIFKPPPSAPCQDMPLAESRADMLATGAHLLIVGNCDPADGQSSLWGALVHRRGPMWDEHGDASAYDPSTTAAPAGGPQPDGCYADRQTRLHDSSFRRWYGDSTWLTAMLGHDQDITASSASIMVRCGVNIIGMDQLRPDDGRLAALVWSWAPEQPAQSGGNCALQEGSTGRNPGRFRVAPCGQPHPFACVEPDASWHVSTAVGSWNSGDAVCGAEFPGSRFGVPANGFRNQLLVEARANPGQSVWLDYSRVGGTWIVNASRSVSAGVGGGASTGMVGAVFEAGGTRARSDRSSAAQAALQVAPTVRRIAASSRPRPDGFVWVALALALCALGWGTRSIVVRSTS